MPRRHSRRAVLAAGTGLLLGACGGTEPVTTTHAPEEPPPPQDLEILAFALHLEYVEAALYEALAEGDVLEGEDRDTASAILDHEREHVAALEAALDELGGRRPPPAEPDLPRLLAGDPESVLARTADLQGLVAAAYLGQAARIEDDDVLGTALRIHAVEARHAAVLGRRVGRPFAPDGALGRGLTAARARARLDAYLL